MLASYRLGSIALAAMLLTSCSADAPISPTPTPPPPPPPTLQLGTYDLTRADGQALPAYIAHRYVDGRLEQVYVDSARLEVAAAGEFTQRIWTRRLRDGVLQYRDTWVDGGAWSLVGEAYRFSSRGGSRELSVRTATIPVLNVVETMAFWPEAGRVAAVYARRTAPPQSPPVTEERFRATDVSGRPLSATVVTERDVPHQNAETYSQLDSAWVALRSNGTYERRAFYSTWMTPNHVLGLGYTRVALVRDADTGTYVRNADGTLVLRSTYFQNRMALGVHLGDRIRLTQDMLAGDPVKPNVGYTIQAAP